MKKIILVLFNVLILAACSSPDQQYEQNVALAKKMFEEFNKHDWNSMAALYSNDAMFLDPSFGTEYVSKTRMETATKYIEFEKIFSNIHDEITGIYPFEDKVTIEFISTGTSADGKSFKLPLACILTIKDGLIVRDATYYDM